MKKKVSDGFGSTVPPSLEQVIVYFMQKNKNENEALSFFNYYTDRKWKNSKGIVISDWKVHAWNWIWNRKD